MKAAHVHQLVDRIFAVGNDCADLQLAQRLAADARRLQSVSEAQQVRAAQILKGLSSFPEKDHADASGSDLGDGITAVERAETAGAAPEIGDGLDNGDVTGAHVDVVADALRELDPAQRELLVAHAVALAAAAKTITPAQFRKHVHGLVRRIQGDGGMSRFQRQQRETRLRLWIDNSGMGRLAGEFDPVTFAMLERRLHDTLGTLFAEATPASCPSDPLKKQDHLRALALAALVKGDVSGSGRPEMIVVVDTTATGENGESGAAVDFGTPVEVPARVLAELAGSADVHVVVVRGGFVLHAPGNLDLGRSTRVASPAQRRVLRALYPTCAIRGCSTRFDHCSLHHIIWWRHGGRSDLANFVPLCSKHHHAVHDDSWHLTITPDRQLTVTMPDGRQMTTGPPKRNAARTRRHERRRGRQSTG